MSVKQLESGKWQATYYYRIDGKLHKKKKSFGSKTEAKIWEQEGKVERRRGVVHHKHSELRTVEDMVNHYRSTLRYKQLGTSTKERYETAIKHILTWAEKNAVYLHEWDRDKAQQFAGYAYENFRGQHVLIMAKALFRSDMQRDNPAVLRDPFAHIQARERKKITPRFFTHAELSLTLSYADEWFRNALLLLVSTGMRNGELVNLEWKNVTDVIRVTDSGEWKPKTFKANREIPLNDTAKQALEYFRQFDSDYVLGRKVRLNRLHNLYAILREKTGLRDTTIHTFRKTFGSLLLQQGVPIAVISNLLGHSSINTTEQIYAALLSSNLRDAVNRLDLNLDP